MRAKLTEISLKKLPSREVRYEVWDTLLPAFGVRVTSEGQKTFVVMYRAHGVQRRQTLGSALTLAAARQLARKLFARVAEGKDPSVEKRARREAGKADSFEAVAAQYIERYAKRHKRERSMREDARLIRVELLPHWAQRRIAEISKADVLAILDKTADRAPIMANRLLALVRKLFNWSQERGYIETSPCAGVRAPSKERARDRVLSDDEVSRLLPAFDALGYPFGPLFRIALLTGQRIGEVAGMRWDEINIEQGVWELSGERVKSGRRHVLPLAGPVIALLTAQPRLGGFVFTSHGDRPVSGFSHAKARVDRLSGITGWRLHDLRRTMATGLARLGTPPHVVSEILGHAPQGITRAVYDRYSYQKEMRESLEKLAEFLLARGPRSEIVPLRSAG